MPAKELVGVGIFIKTIEKDILNYRVQLHFLETNNKVEHQAILTRLRIAKALGAKKVILKRGLQLIVG